MGLIQSNPRTLGALTQDYLGTYFDQIMAVAGSVAAIETLAPHIDNLTALYAVADDLLNAASTIEDGVKLIETAQPIIEAARTVVLSALTDVINISAAVTADKNTTFTYLQSAQAASSEAAADATLIQNMIDDAGINAVTLDLGDRLNDTATLTYGSRV